MSTHRCMAELVQIKPLTDSILQLILKPERYVAYQAGQYLQIMLDDEPLSFSIANAPLGAHSYELHIRHSGGDPYLQPLFAHLKTHGQCRIRLPLGNCSLTQLDEHKPIIFVAGGTGFAPIKALIEEMLAREDSRAMYLFWGARDLSDIYLQTLVQDWDSHVTHFTANIVIDSQKEKALVGALLALKAPPLIDAQFVISGPFPLVYHIRDQLLAQGITASAMHSDAFAFES